MGTTSKGTRFRFGTFEADTSSGELRKQGLRIRLGRQPFQVLLMLVQRTGEVVTREEIQQTLWPEGTFVDFDHGLNSAINRIREALGDAAASPRFLETLARKGYRFLAPVERIDSPELSNTSPALDDKAPHLGQLEPIESSEIAKTILASPEELPKAPHTVVRLLFCLLQVMYLSFYIGALANLFEVDELLAALLPRTHAIQALVISAAISIPVRLFLLSAGLFRPPRAKVKFLKLFPLILLLDLIWALSPFLLLHHINVGLALGATAALVYSPFAQRSLILMGAGDQQ